MKSHRDLKNKLTIIALPVLLVLAAVGCYFLLSTLLHKKTIRKQTIRGSGFAVYSCEQIDEKDIYNLCRKIRNRDTEEFDAVMMTNRLHGHVGPVNIIGAKMGLLAKKLLKGTNNSIIVFSEAGEPPQSCLNDGLQSSIGSSLGKIQITNLKVETPKLAATFFYNDQYVRLEAKPEIVDEINNRLDKALAKYNGLTDEYFWEIRKEALDVWENYSRENLFNITYPNKDDKFCDDDALWRGYIDYKLNRLIWKKEASTDEISIFLNKNKCLKENSAVVSKTENKIEVYAVWKSDGKDYSFP